MECQVDVTVVGTPDVGEMAGDEAGRQVVIVIGDISRKAHCRAPALEYLDGREDVSSPVHRQTRS
jgi:hypothetical protein